MTQIVSYDTRLAISTGNQIVVLALVAWLSFPC